MKNNNTFCRGNYRVYTAKDASDLFKGRDLYIWGAGQKGRGFKLALNRNGFPVKAFLDSSPLLIGTEYGGVPILDPKIVLNNPKTCKSSFILVASVDKKNKEMFALCESAGLTKNKDFINIQELSPFYPTVEISGVCNLRCLSCPRGDSAHLPQKGGFMTADYYSRVIDKLIKEIPFLYLVDLYIWGEPLLNPELSEIIKINTNLGIASGISSNLNAGKYLEDVIKASPAQIRVSVSGYGEKNYEITHKGGRWEIFYQNLLLLAEYINKYQTNTIVEVYYHVYKNNLNESKQMRELCEENGFRFHPVLAMLLADHAFDYCEGKGLSDEAKKAGDLMLIGLEKLIQNGIKERHKQCLLNRVLPVINWDMSVMPCCNYSYHKLADNYLEISLDDIINLRHTHSLCVKCQKYSLHRYFNPMYYSDYVNTLVC
ncbi:MAG: radical SAM protein [Nitrospirae bacterium]|nr:radical SAM protein [Nitrospirota bacterium]